MMVNQLVPGSARFWTRGTGQENRPAIARFRLGRVCKGDLGIAPGRLFPRSVLSLPHSILARMVTVSAVRLARVCSGSAPPALTFVAAVNCVGEDIRSVLSNPSSTVRGGVEKLGGWESRTYGMRDGSFCEM